ncbi:MAG: ATP-binding protein [Chitinophagaceae bacterium]
MSSPVITHDMAVPEFLSGGGEMGKLIRSKDWSKTPLGSPDSWPQSLRTTVSLCIASNFPISIAWGPHRVQIYNDGYWPICGDKHPTSMGQDYKECWLSAWPVIGQAFEEASLGQTRFLENQRMFLDRYGYLEETFFTFSFSPILDESGGVGGLFHPVTELTHQTLAERRLNIVRAVADHTVNARTAEEASSLILGCLKDFELDLPFVLIYTIAANGKEANLVGSVGIDAGSPLAPVTVNLMAEQSNSWPFTEVIQKGKAVQVEKLADIFGTFNCGPYPEPPEQALVFPVTLHGTAHNNYFLVAGVSSRRRLDEKCLLFYEILTSSVNNALIKARAHEEERKKAEALAEIDKAKTVFFSNISHEFRTPLTLMLGSLEELLNKRSDEIRVSDKEAIETSHRNAMRLLRLVNNLLEFSRIESGKVQAQYQLTDLAKYTAELSSNFRPVVENAGLKFEVKTDTIIQPVYIDKEMWEKIVLNLLSNAFKYTLKGSITLSITTGNNQVFLKVRDTGVGIPENELPKIFQRFHRVQNVVGRTYEGTGIGLSLVSELVKLHGGEISVQSKEAEGSVFAVSIPTGKWHLPSEHIVEKETDFTSFGENTFIDEAATLIIDSKPAISDKASLKVNANADTVLVVDDNADMRAYIKRRLEKQYHVVTANNGIDALQQIKHHSPQLILSDIMMPVMDGIQLLKAVKENAQTHNIPVIFLTARAGEESIIEGYETGADDYLVKPFSAKELLARVASQLKLVKLRQATETNVRNLFMQAPAVICVLRGPQHIYEIVNAMYLQVIGNRDVVGKPIREALPELEGTGLFELLDEVYRTGEPFIANEMPVTLQKANGKLEEGIFNFIYQASRNAEGMIDGILAHAVDITDHVLARRKIAESESRFRNLADESPMFVFIIEPNAEATINYWNKTWLNYTGQSFDEALGRAWNGIIHPDDVPGVMEIYVPAFESRIPYLLPAIRVKRHDGIYRWHMIKSNPHYLPSGEFIGFIGVGIDIHEQKLAEENLAYRTALLEAHNQASVDGVLLVDARGKIISYNQRFIEIWHMPQHIVDAKDDEAALSFAMTQLVNPQQFIDKVKYLYDHPTETSLDELEYKDGKIVERNGYPVVGEDGSYYAWSWTFKDITERKKIGQDLKNAKEQLEFTFRNVPAAIYLFDKDGKILFLNELGAKQIGYETVEAVLKEENVFEISKKLDEAFIVLDQKGKPLPADESSAAISFKTGMPSEVVAQFIHRQTGSFFWILSKSSPLFNEKGELSIVLTTSTEITIQKKSEQVIRQSEELFRTLSESLPQLVWMTDEKGKYEYASNQWMAYSGLDPHDETAWPLLIYPDDMEPMMKAWTLSLATGKNYHAEARLKSKEGEYRWHFVQGEPVKDEAGKILKWIGAFTDIHEQKTITEKLENLVAERTKELQRSNEDLQQFAHVTSHDLKEPVRKIRIFGNRLSNDFGAELPEKAKIYLAKMESAATRLCTMIDGVLIYSSLDSEVLSYEIIDLNETIRDIEEDLELLIAQKNGIIQYQNLPSIEGSSILIYQLFYNLINNSLKFSKKHIPPVLEINSEAAHTTDLMKHSLKDIEEGYVKIMVKDNGIGFSVNEAEKIFKTFSRLHSKDLYEGTGLGLALCEKIVQRHHGSISAEGQEEEGATFKVILPVKHPKKFTT